MADEVVDIVLPLINAEVISRLLIALIKHVIFIRNQIPVLYESIVSDVEKAKKPNKKALKFIQQFTQLEQTLTSFLQSHHPSVVVVSLGASPTSPKELFTIYFAPPTPLPHAITYTERNVSDWIRNMIRSCVVADFPSQNTNLGATKVSIMLQTQQGTTISDWPEGIIPKQSYVLKHPKRKGALMFRSSSDPLVQLPPVPPPLSRRSRKKMQETIKEYDDMIMEDEPDCLLQGSPISSIPEQSNRNDNENDEEHNINNCEGEWGQVKCVLKGWIVREGSNAHV